MPGIDDISLISLPPASARTQSAAGEDDAVLRRSDALVVDDLRDLPLTQLPLCCLTTALNGLQRSALS